MRCLLSCVVVASAACLPDSIRCDDDGACPNALVCDDGVCRDDDAGGDAAPSEGEGEGDGIALGDVEVLPGGWRRVSLLPAPPVDAPVGTAVVRDGGGVRIAALRADDEDLVAVVVDVDDDFAVTSADLGSVDANTGAPVLFDSPGGLAGIAVLSLGAGETRLFAWDLADPAPRAPRVDDPMSLGDGVTALAPHACPEREGYTSLVFALETGIAMRSFDATLHENVSIRDAWGTLAPVEHIDCANGFVGWIVDAHLSVSHRTAPGVFVDVDADEQFVHMAGHETRAAIAAREAGVVHLHVVDTAAPEDARDFAIAGARVAMPFANGSGVGAVAEASSAPDLTVYVLQADATLAEAAVIEDAGHLVAVADAGNVIVVRDGTIALVTDRGGP